MTLTIELWITGLCYYDVNDNFDDYVDDNVDDNVDVNVDVNVDGNDNLGGGEQVKNLVPEQHWGLHSQLDAMCKIILMRVVIMMWVFHLTRWVSHLPR